METYAASMLLAGWESKSIEKERIGVNGKQPLLFYTKLRHGIKTAYITFIGSVFFFAARLLCN